MENSIHRSPGAKARAALETVRKAAVLVDNMDAQLARERTAFVDGNLMGHARGWREGYEAADEAHAQDWTALAERMRGVVRDPQSDAAVNARVADAERLCRSLADTHERQFARAMATGERDHLGRRVPS